MVGVFSAWKARFFMAIGSVRAKDAGLAVAFVAVIATYAWLASSLFVPVESFPLDAVSGAAIKREGRLELWQDASFGANSLGSGVRARASVAAAFARQLGGFARPLDLIVDFDRPHRWSVAAERIEIGVAAAEAEGSLEKAFFKAWALQSASSAVRSSAVRVEVVSDVLLAAFLGRFALEDSLTKAIARFSRGEAAPSWHGRMVSFRRACETGWAPFEASALCEGGRLRDSAWADEPAAIGSRPILSELIWRAFAGLSPFERLSFIRSWSAWIRTASERGPRSSPTTILAWRDWLRAEFRFLLPASVLGGSAPERALAVLEVESEIRPEEGPVRFDFAFKGEARPGDAKDAGWRSVFGRRDGSRPAAWAMPSIDRGAAGVALEAGAALFLPGLVRWTGDVAASLAAADLIWESCEAPTLAQASGAVRAKRILFVRDCGEVDADYRPYLRFGGEAFARANPEVPFLLMNRAAIQYLVARGLKKPQDSVLSLVDHEDAVLSRALLPNASAWLPLERAYRVAGVLPGATLYRLSPAKGVGAR